MSYRQFLKWPKFENDPVAPKPIEIAMHWLHHSYFLQKRCHDSYIRFLITIIDSEIPFENIQNDPPCTVGTVVGKKSFLDKYQSKKKRLIYRAFYLKN